MPKLFLPRHAHTHNPGGSDPLHTGTISSFRATFNGGAVITATNNSEKEMLWDAWEISDASVFQAGPLVGGRLLTLKIMEPGVYLVKVEVKWEDDGFTNGIIYHDGYFGPSSVGHTYVPHNLSPSPVFSNVYSYYPYDPAGGEFNHASPPTNPVSTQKVEVVQSSGTSQNLYTFLSEWHIHRIGDLNLDP